MASGKSVSEAKAAPEKPARLSKNAEDERDPYDEEDPDSIDQNDGSDYEDPNEPPPEEMPQQQISNQNYVVLPGSGKDVKRLETKPPSLPDLSPYTSAAARAAPSPRARNRGQSRIRACRSSPR